MPPKVALSGDGARVLRTRIRQRKDFVLGNRSMVGTSDPESFPTQVVPHGMYLGYLDNRGPFYHAYMAAAAQGRIQYVVRSIGGVVLAFRTEKAWTLTRERVGYGRSEEYMLAHAFAITQALDGDLDGKPRIPYTRATEY